VPVRGPWSERVVRVELDHDIAAEAVRPRTEVVVSARRELDAHHHADQVAEDTWGNLAGPHTRGSGSVPDHIPSLAEMDVRPDVIRRLGSHYTRSPHSDGGALERTSARF
jgi:hypothetical protein